MKKFFCGEVCAPEFVRVGVPRKLVDGHRVIGNQVAKFVELVNSHPVRGGVHHQEKIAKQVVDEGSQGTRADFCWQQNRVLTYWHEQQFCGCCVSIEFPHLRLLLSV